MHLINLIQERKSGEKLFLFFSRGCCFYRHYSFIKDMPSGERCIQIIYLDLQIPKEGPLGNLAYI